MFSKVLKDVTQLQLLFCSINKGSDKCSHEFFHLKYCQRLTEKNNSGASNNEKEKW